MEKKLAGWIMTGGDDGSSDWFEFAVDWPDGAPTGDEMHRPVPVYFGDER